MKNNYMVITLSIVIIVLFALLFGIRSDLRNVRNELSYTRNELSRVNSNVSYLEGSMREMEDILSQEDIIVGVESTITPIDVMEGTASANVEIHASNIHNDSTVNLVLTRTGYTKNNYEMRYVVYKDSYDIEEDIYEAPVETEESFTVEMIQSGTGVYSVDVPVMFGSRYEAYVVIEHEGMIYQEQVNSLYVYDETSIDISMHIFHIEYDESDDAIKLDMFVDVESRNKLSIESAELIVYDGDIELDRIDFLETLDDSSSIHGEVRIGAELEELYSLPYEENGIRAFVLRVEDEYGRVTEFTNIIEMK